MKKLYTIIFMFILSSATPLYSWDSEAAKFYPLAIGNQWSYHREDMNGFGCTQVTSTTDYIVTVVSDTLMSNGKWYYKLVRTGGLTYYERIDSTTMNVFKYSSGNECLIDSLFAMINNNFNGSRDLPNCFQQFPAKILDTNNINFAGVLRRAKFIQGGGLIGYTHNLMYGIGLFRERACEAGFGSQTTLNGCIIDGVQYGEMLGSSNFITGIVRFEDNNQPVSSGYVKALEHSSLGGNVVVIDSVPIHPNGVYLFKQVFQDTVDLMAFDDDTENAYQYVPTYYPSTIEWQNALPIYPGSGLSNINIGVFRLVNDMQSSGNISGSVYLTTDFPSSPLHNAIVYAKTGNVFKGYSVSLSSGSYSIGYLPQGSYQLTCSRIGYNTSSVNQQLGASNLSNVNFFLEQFTGIYESAVPVGYSLLQNYPNPFNPATEITFNIPVASIVKLYVYDALGKETQMLLDKEMKAGKYSIQWDATAFPSGVYFYRLTAGDFTDTKKMVLIK